MTTNLQENEVVLPKEHWICQKCGATKNLIRSHDISKPTFCKPCLIEMRSDLQVALNEYGVKWLLEALISAVEKVPTYPARKFVVRHIVSVLDDRVQDWSEEE